MLKRHSHKRNLPHLYYNEGIYFVTYRLYGSIPLNELKLLKQLSNIKTDLSSNQRENVFKKYDSLLDKPSSTIQHLLQPEIMEICKSSIHHYDRELYKLICYCIMPNHIHLVFELLDKEKQIGEILGSIKKYSARRSNKILNQTGHFWPAESYDRLVRDDIELFFTIRYVLLNPVNAGLVKQWSSWRGTFCRPEYQVID